MTDEVTSDPLAALRRRWEIEKSPKLTLQLAEEYGRRDDYLSAITVLRTGLTRHPRHVASRVLLGRYLVELEQWPEARDLLEKVAGEDPTHLIANKLLVKAYLAIGNPAEARNRLDLYTLLNESDPEIEELARRLGEATDESLDETAAGPEPETAPAPRGALATEPEAEPLPETEVPLEPEALFEPDEVLAGPSGPFDEVAPAAMPPLAEPPGRPAVSTRGAARSAAPPPASDEPFGDLRWVPEVEAPAADSIFELRRPAAAPPAVGGPEEPAAGAQEPPAAPPEEDLPPATVSLGRLYLQQGHRREAERAFAAVLEREPDNAAARAGLAAARGPREWRLTALDLVPPELLGEAAPAARKRALLTGYLERLRGGATGG